MLISLQAAAPHLAFTVEGLSHVVVPESSLCKWCLRLDVLQTQFTSTVKAASFVLVLRTIWQGSEADLAFQKTLYFIHFFSDSGLFLRNSL